MTTNPAANEHTDTPNQPQQAKYGQGYTVSPHYRPPTISISAM